ncbi:hypothetical protein HK104_002966, partial [Borealophlyctis nickersoniae]
MSYKPPPQPVYPTFFGRPVYPTPILKVYWPFFLSGTLAFFLGSWAHTKLTNAPDDKWLNIV